MGGRGASSGESVNGKKYGSEYHAVHQFENIKFIVYNDASNAKTPMETMTPGRVYGVVNKDGMLRSIVTFDSENKRNRQIDIEGKPHTINGVRTLPHTHHGYNHDEYSGTKSLSNSDLELVVKAVRAWYNRRKK